MFFIFCSKIQSIKLLNVLEMFLFACLLAFLSLFILFFPLGVGESRGGGCGGVVGYSRVQSIK